MTSVPSPPQLPGRDPKEFETGEDHPLCLLGKLEAILWVLEVQQEATSTTGIASKAKGKWRS